MEYNASSKHLDENEILGPAVTWTYLSVRALQGLIAVVANLVTIIVVYKDEYLLENNTSKLVASLALADLVGGLGTFSAIFRNAKIFSTIKMMNGICYLSMFLNIVASMGNVYNLLITTIDRYIYITRPLHYHSIVTKGRAIAAIVIVWAIAIPEAILIMALASNVNPSTACKLDTALSKVGFLILPFQIALITLLMIVPLYGKIGYTAWKLGKTEPDLCHYPPETRAKQLVKLWERRMVKTIGLVLATYLICYIPTSLFGAVVRVLHATPFPFGILVGNRIFRVIYKMQSVLNPFIYGWKDKNFKRAFKNFLGCNRPVVQ